MQISMSQLRMKADNKSTLALTVAVASLTSLTFFEYTPAETLANNKWYKFVKIRPLFSNMLAFGHHLLQYLAVNRNHSKEGSCQNVNVISK